MTSRCGHVRFRRADRSCRHGQLPLEPIDIADPPGQPSWQVDPPEQFTEQLPVHVMRHVAPPEQSTLALGPTVIVHIEDPVHLRLHDEPHEPEQSFMFAQSSVQLLPHVPPPIVHD